MDGRTTQNLWALALQWIEHSWQLSVIDSSLLDNKGLDISDVVCVDSPVMIKVFTKKVNKQVHEKFGIFRDHSASI